MRRRWVARAMVVALAATACGRDASVREAERLVRRYNDQLIAAFRAGDAGLMEGLVGEEEARRLYGLIGVKSDMGITLDAALQEFSVLGVEHSGDGLLVRTEERWAYRDRRIGGGETVGPPSEDHYRMRYMLLRVRDTLVVAQVRFAAPPEVGRAAQIESSHEALMRSRLAREGANPAADTGRPRARR
jgi:hypothetical protein